MRTWAAEQPFLKIIAQQKSSSFLLIKFFSKYLGSGTNFTFLPANILTLVCIRSASLFPSAMGRRHPPPFLFRLALLVAVLQPHAWGFQPFFQARWGWQRTTMTRRHAGKSPIDEVLDSWRGKQGTPALRSSSSTVPITVTTKPYKICSLRSPTVRRTTRLKLYPLV